LGKVDDQVITGTVTVIFYESSPVDSSGTVAGTQAGDLPVAWRSVASLSASYGNRFFAICSASSDASVASATFTSPVSGGVSGVGSVSCPAGQRALAGGLSLDTPPGDKLYRLGFQAPAASVGTIGTASTGAPSRSMLFSAKPSDNVVNTYRAFATCATEPPPPEPTPPSPTPPSPTPPDTTLPDTTITKGPAKETHRTKATFRFEAETGSTFTCKVDKKKARPCASPFKLKNLTVGKHKVTVTATDPAGNVEKKPATYTWKVLERCAGECRRSGAQESGA
jgi:hypothetical protein